MKYIKGVSGIEGVLVSMLALAVDDIRSGDPRLAVPAASWIASDCEDDPLAFVQICGRLGIDPEHFRLRLRRRYGVRRGTDRVGGEIIGGAGLSTEAIGG